MKKDKQLFVIAVLASLQLFAALAMSITFAHYRREAIDLFEEQIREDGVPRDQAQAYSSALYNITSSVSSYVWNITFMMIMLNGASLYLIALNQRGGEETPAPKPAP